MDAELTVTTGRDKATLFGEEQVDWPKLSENWSSAEIQTMPVKESSEQLLIMVMIGEIIHISLTAIILVGRTVMNPCSNGGCNEYCNKKLKANFI